MSLPGGPSVLFPAGAVAASQTITVQQTSQTSPGGAPIFQFGPAGAQFAAPVEVTLPLPSGFTGPASIYWTKLNSTTQYDALAASAAAGGVKASVTHFSNGFVGPACTQGQACTVPGTACQAGAIDCSTGAPACAGLAPVADGTACGTGSVCSAGACVAACVDGEACQTVPPDPCKLFAKACNATRTGFFCAFTGNAAVGIDCGPGHVCSGGACVAICVQGTACQPATPDPCHTHQLNCNATLTAGTCDPVLPLQNGATCGTDQVCSGGACVACTAGGSCASANECHTAAFSCSTGSQVCADTGNKANGTTCAGGVCGGGACNPCTPGAACVSANPCHTANEVCTSGFRVCADSGNQPAGTACGSGLVCDANASCIAACLAGQPCAGTDPCKSYQTACSADLSLPASCVATADRADGTSCGAGLVCAGGTCGCNTVALGAAPAVAPAKVAQAAPAPTGGPVLDGTYHLTAMTVYTGPGGASGPVPGELRSQVFLLSGGPYQVLEVRNGAVFRSNGSYALFGSRLVHRATCGSSEAQDQGYSASGAEVRIYDASKPNETLEMLLVRQGPTCIDGQACTVASPDPCKVYGLTCDAAHASGTCGALANAPVGTPCGAASACDAGGACAASATRTVSGTWRSTWWLDSGARLELDELVGPADAIAAITGSGASATRLPGTLLPNGTFAIPGVPFGPYVLELVLAGFVPLYADETESALDLGVDWMGRPDAALATLSTQVTFNVSGLTPWAAGDGFVVTAPNVSHGSAGSLGPMSPGLAAAATAGSFGYESRTVANNFGFGLIDTAAGDQVWIHQMVATSLTAPGGAATALAAGPWVRIPSMTVQDGVPASVGSAQAPVALQAPPSTGSTTVDFRGTQFAAHAPEVNPLARRVNQGRVNVLASARGLTRPLPVNYNDYLPLRIPLLNLELGNTPLLNLDTDFGALSYGTGFFPGFPEWRLAVRNVNVTYVAPGATTGFTVGSGLGRADAMPAPAGPITPALTPPLAPMVNGQDARTFQGDIGLTPTLSWSPPAVGTPTATVVQVIRIAAAGAATTGITVASYRTAAASITLPPGVLQDGSTYVFHIQAFQTGATPAADLLNQPRRRGMATAWGFALTGLLRTCSAGNCPACADGSACGTPGSCQVAALSCANGFLCALSPAPDETGCGQGTVCSGGQCVPDINGTWMGGYSRAGTINGAAYADSSHTMARSLVQSGSTVLQRGVTTTGARGRQTCTRSGATLTCSGHGSNGDCTFAVTSTATLQATTPPTLLYDYTSTFGGGSCVGSETGSATLTKRLSSGAGGNITGAYSSTGTFTSFAGSTEIGTGTMTGQTIVSQVGNSFVTDGFLSTGATTTCIGYVDVSPTARLCAGANGACSFAGMATSSGGVLTYDYAFGSSCGGTTRQTGTITSTQTCAGSSCPRTVSGRFATTFWPDAGNPTVVATAKPAGTTVSALVPGASGYTSYAGTLAGDGSFSIPGVPAGAYFLQVVEGGVPSLYQLTTSTPNMRRLRSARPDVASATASTPVTINYTNLLPYHRSPNDQLWFVSSQAEIDAQIVPSMAPYPAASSTSYSPVADFAGLHLPDAAKGDAVYVFQRRAAALAAGPTGALQVLRKTERYARLAGATGATVTSGAAATVDAPLVDAPLTQTASADVRTTQFAAFAPQVNPLASGTSFFAGLGAQPHAVAYPAPTAMRMRLLGLFLDLSAPDTAYQNMSYGGFLDAALWKEWWTAGATFATPFTAAGAGATPFNTGINSDYLPPVGSVTIAPQQGPVTAPLVNGADAFTARTGVGAEPMLSWSAPGLGVPTSYYVRIHQVRNAAGVTDFPLVFSAAVRGTSLRVPPGVLVAGSTYLAVVQAFQAPWDVPDAPPLLYGAPAHWAETVTSTFSP